MDLDQYWLGEDDLETDAGGPLAIEHPTKIRTKALSPKDGDDRVRMVFDMNFVRYHTVTALMMLALLLQAHVTQAQETDSRPLWDWLTVTPESQGMASAKLEAVWTNLQKRHTTAFMVIHNDRIVFERYASGYHRTKPHYTASMAKALVGGVGLMLAMHDGRITPDDRAGKYVLQWANDPQRMGITVRHLASHTSGIEDAEANDLPHRELTGWKGDFWKGLPPPNDPFTIARDLAPVCDVPGTKERYSNLGMAMLGYCVTASLRGTPDTDLRSLLAHRVMEPIGVPQEEWSVGYGTQTSVDGLTLVATWGGGAYSPNAVARLGRLMLHQGNWEGKQLVSSSAVEKVIEHSGMPGHSGLGWWVNAQWDGNKLWSSAPEDAFGGAGAGQQFLLAVPSLDLIVVRNGEQLDNDLSFWEGLEQHVVRPVLQLLPRGNQPPSDASTISPTLSTSVSTPARTRR